MINKLTLGKKGKVYSSLLSIKAIYHHMSAISSANGVIPLSHLMRTFLASVLLSLCLAESYANSVTQWPTDLLGRIRFGISDEFNDSGLDLQNTLFEALTDLNMSFDNGPFEFGVRVRRQVYDNQDIVNSWTVIDSFQIPTSLSFNVLDPVTFATSGIAQLNLGVRFNLNSFHIRQVLPANIDNLPSIQALKTEARRLEDEARNSADETDEVQADGDEMLITSFDAETEDAENLFSFLSLRTENPRTRARYGRILNLFTSPFGLPLTPKLADKMPTGDIRSYSLDGSIQFGPNVGWGPLSVGSANLDLNISAGFATFVRGQWRVSVLKESEHQVQVKLTRDTSKGITAYLGSRTQDHEVFEGFLVMGSRIGGIRGQVIPFHFSANKDLRTSFDIGYRYDLRDPEARKAYALAIMGRLKLSDELAQKSAGVTEVFTREQLRERRDRIYRMRLSLFYQRARYRSDSTSNALITLEGREYHVFSAMNENSRSSDTLWGSSELNNLKFVTTVDEDLYNENRGGLTFSIEGRIEDRRTTGREYMEAIAQIEHSTGLIGLFPRVPVNTPKDQECTDVSPARFRDVRGRRNDCPKLGLTRLGETSFYYRVAFEREQMEHFFSLEHHKMWSILEEAFDVKKGQWSSPIRRIWFSVRNAYATVLNIPLLFLDQHIDQGNKLIMAKLFMKRWQETQAVTHDPKVLVDKMGKLFSTTNFSLELVNILRLVMADQKMAVLVQARAPKVFGQISEQRLEFDPLDHLIRRANDIIDFDRIGARTAVDTEARIQELDIKYLSDEEVSISFFLPKTPQYLFFNLEHTPGWGRYRALMKTVLANNGQFREGANQIIITQNDEDPLRKELAKHFFNPDNQVTFKMAVSIDGARWGSVSSDKPRRRR